MAEWKLVVVSGSDARLNSLQLTTKLGVAYGGTGTGSIGNNNFLVGSAATTYTHVGSNGSGTVVRTTGASSVRMSGSFTGSFVGDGTGLTGLPTGAVTSYTNSGNDRLITSVDSSTINGEANLTFNGSVLGVTGRISASMSITGSDLKLASLGTGVDNTVLIIDAAGNVLTDEIDARVWGATLIDGAGANTRVAYYTDADTISSDANFTYASSVLTVGSSTFGTNTVIAGNLSVLGTTINLNITNAAVEDRFILLNSGSAAGDGGIIVQTEASYSGVVWGWDDSATRWGFQNNVKLSSTASVIAPDAFGCAVVDINAGMTDIATHQKNGNIKVSGSNIFIYA